VLKGIDKKVIPTIPNPLLGYIFVSVIRTYILHRYKFKVEKRYAYKILTKIVKCFACGKYGHTYVKCVTNPIKAKKLKVNRIEKRKDKITLGEDLGVEWIVEVIKFFNSSTLYEQYGSFIKGASNVAKKEDEKKTKSKR